MRFIFLQNFRYTACNKTVNKEEKENWCKYQSIRKKWLITQSGALIYRFLKIMHLLLSIFKLSCWNYIFLFLPLIAPDYRMPGHRSVLLILHFPAFSLLRFYFPDSWIFLLWGRFTSIPFQFFCCSFLFSSRL